MAKTLLNFVADDLARGCVSVAQEHSLILGLLPQRTTGGSMTHLYNIAEELVNADFRNINEDFEGSYVEPVQMVETLKILSADVKLDRIFLTGGVGNVTDVLSEQTALAMMGLATKYENQFFYGEGTGKDFKGLYPRISDGVGKVFNGTISGETANADAEMELIDECIDYISYSSGEKVIVCNPKTRRKLNKLMRNSNTATTSVEMFGKFVSKYDDVIIYTSEAVKDNQIFFMNLEENHGVCGLTTNGLVAQEQGFQGVHKITAVEMIAGLKTPHPRCFAVLEPAMVKTRSK